VGADGAVRGHRLVRGVIRSRHRLAYETAQAVLDGGDGVDEPTDTAIRQLERWPGCCGANGWSGAASTSTSPRRASSSMSSGEPTDIQRVVRLDAHRLVEDFMLLANESSPGGPARPDCPFLYRIHEPPDTSRMEQLRDFVATFGHRLSGRAGAPTPRDLQRLLRAAEGRPEEGLLSTVVLRSMKQARYSEQNLGHFGLATRTYTHFTSPIRRYPDLIVHRIAAGIFIDGAEPWLDTERLADMARWSSERERLAVAAERDSKDLKKVEYMQRHLGDEFDGTVSGVTSFGFFVLLDDRLRGGPRARELPHR
jgi:ribonuclease R